MQHPSELSLPNYSHNNGGGKQIQKQTSHCLEEISFTEIERGALLGKGSFGTVFRAVWHHPSEGPREVAIKYFETEAEKMEFNIERKQLARVRHPHIIQMFGACLQPFVSKNYCDQGESEGGRNHFWN